MAGSWNRASNTQALPEDHSCGHHTRSCPRSTDRGREVSVDGQGLSVRSNSWEKLSKDFFNALFPGRVSVIGSPIYSNTIPAISLGSSILQTSGVHSDPTSMLHSTTILPSMMNQSDQWTMKTRSGLCFTYRALREELYQSIPLAIEPIHDDPISCNFVPCGKPESGIIYGARTVYSSRIPAGRPEDLWNACNHHGCQCLAQISRFLINISNRRKHQCPAPLSSLQASSKTSQGTINPTATTSTGRESSTIPSSSSEIREEDLYTSTTCEIQRLDEAVDPMIIDSVLPEVIDTDRDATPLSSLPAQFFWESDPITSVPKKKRAGDHLSEDFYHHGPPRTKRPRDEPPHPIRRESNKKLRQRTRRRAEDMARHVLARREQRDRQLIQDIIADMSRPTCSVNTTLREHQEQTPAFTADDESADIGHSGAHHHDNSEHEAALAGSRHKRTGFQEDSQEHVTRDRELQEIDADTLRRQRRTNAQYRAKVEREQAERRRHLAEKKRLDAQFERQKSEERARQRRDRRAQATWTPERAIERYITDSEIFDTTKFTPDNPLTFAAVPWPTLTSPLALRQEEMKWTVVEAFFKILKERMIQQEYRILVEKSHRRFHPDRWCSRGLLATIADDTERSYIEVAANTVAQALTPIWRDLKS